MNLSEYAKPTFARHETFQPRYAWFRKACVAVENDAEAFGRPDATVHFGVGKNMVRSIRFWALAGKLIAPRRENGKKNPKKLALTTMGSALFSDSGWDPYLEDPGTLWLLHWLLLSAPCELPVWWVIFNAFSGQRFREDDLQSFVLKAFEERATWARPSVNSLKKDLGVFLKAYAPARRKKRSVFEEALDSPLRELGLIRRAKDEVDYQFPVCAKPSLPAAIVCFASLRYAAFVQGGSRSISVRRLVNGAGAPGRIFRLSTQDLLELLEAGCEQFSFLRLTVQTGNTLLSWQGSANPLSLQVLEGYYGKQVAALRVGAEFFAGYVREPGLSLVF